jgi:hypothetical protein
MINYGAIETWAFPVKQKGEPWLTHEIHEDAQSNQQINTKIDDVTWRRLPLFHGKYNTKLNSHRHRAAPARGLP